MTYEVLNTIKLRSQQEEIELQPGQLITLEHERALTLIQRGKIRAVASQLEETLVCESCSASSMWESPSGEKLHCFSYALFPPVRGGKPHLCEEAIRDCEHKGNIEMLRTKYHRH